MAPGERVVRKSCAGLPDRQAVGLGEDDGLDGTESDLALRGEMGGAETAGRGPRIRG